MQLHQKFCGGDALCIFLLQEGRTTSASDQALRVVVNGGKVLHDLVTCRSFDLVQNPVRTAQRDEVLCVTGEFVCRLWGLRMASEQVDRCVNRFMRDGVDKRYRIRVLQ